MNVAVFHLGDTEPSAPQTLPIVVPWVSDTLTLTIDLTASQWQGALDQLRSISISGQKGTITFTFASGQILTTDGVTKTETYNVLQPNPIRFNMLWDTAGTGVPGVTKLTLNLNNFFNNSNKVS